MTIPSKVIAYIAVVVLVGISSYLTGIEATQITSITVFSFIVAGALLFWRFRLAFALFGLGILFAARVMDVETFIESAGLDIILFLIGMMIVIGFLEERHFFEVLLDKIIGYAGDSTYKIVGLLMLMAAFSAALVDEVTSILFVTSTVIHLTSRLRISTVPLVMATVFATNIGSSATVVGNPVGVMIALNAKLGFSDFLRWATPISIISLILSIAIVFIIFKGYIKEMKKSLESLKSSENSLRSNTGEKTQGVDKVALIVFLGTITGLVLHTQIEELLGLKKNTMLIGVAVIAAAIVLFLQRDKARELVERRVDWWTLSFFLVFFSSVGTLEFTGVTTLLANFFINISGDLTSNMLITGWVSGLMSAGMDNVLAVALWISIVEKMGELGINIFPLWWVMLFGATFMGNLTPIGSTANIVAIGMIERQKMGHISLKTWIIPGAMVSIPTFTLSLLLLLLQLPLMLS
ncbi:MAG TPA: hypothetical protein EYH45_05140 [Candidatus Caldiarchaeum subterraneum]|uniref:Citrate transporter-like domain-containing protein n=1 Tax=Caldiarchaeum subterraneum TaxID=311458 RepID=A0A832ZWU6_CALS0|nr:hypothetical protein [Candidatus Caldarchaeum subterraneum]